MPCLRVLVTPATSGGVTYLTVALAKTPNLKRATIAHKKCNSLANHIVEYRIDFLQVIRPFREA